MGGLGLGLGRYGGLGLGRYLALPVVRLGPGLGQGRVVRLRGKGLGFRALRV